MEPTTLFLKEALEEYAGVQFSSEGDSFIGRIYGQAAQKVTDAILEQLPQQARSHMASTGKPPLALVNPKLAEGSAERLLEYKYHVWSLIADIPQEVLEDLQRRDGGGGSIWPYVTKTIAMPIPAITLRSAIEDVHYRSRITFKELEQLVDLWSKKRPDLQFAAVISSGPKPTVLYDLGRLSRWEDRKSTGFYVVLMAPGNLELYIANAYRLKIQEQERGKYQDARVEVRTSLCGRMKPKGVLGPDDPNPWAIFELVD